MKYKLKLKGRTDKKNLTVNIGGEIKQYSKKECFDGIDVTDYLDEVDPKFMAIEDNFVEKVKVNEEYKDFVSASDFLINNDIDIENLTELSREEKLSVELAPQYGPYEVPTPMGLGSFNEYTRLCNIDDVYVMLETTGAYYSLDGCLNWQRSRGEDNAFASYTHYGNPMFVYENKFWWLANNSLYYTDKTLKTRNNFDESLQFNSVDSDGHYIYAKVANEDRILVYYYPMNSNYISITSQDIPDISKAYKVECFPYTDGCFIYTSNYTYFVHTDKDLLGNHYIESIQRFPTTNKIVQVLKKQGNNLFILGRDASSYCIFDSTKQKVVNLDIGSIRKATLELGYDHENSNLLIIDNYGHIKGDDNRIIYNYDIESKTLSERHSSPVTSGELKFMHFEDYHLIYEYSYSSSNLYDINFNLIASDVEEWSERKPNLYRTKSGSNYYNYYLCGMGAVQIKKSFEYNIPENIYIYNRELDDIKSRIEDPSDKTCDIVSVNENFNFSEYINAIQSNTSIDNPENSSLIKQTLLVDGNEYKFSLDKALDRHISIKYTFGSTELKIVDAFSFIDMADMSNKNVTKNGRILSSIKLIKLCKNAFTDENDNRIKYALFYL